MGQVPSRILQDKDTEVMNENDGAVGKPVAGKSAPFAGAQPCNFQEVELEIRSETHDQLKST